MTESLILSIALLALPIILLLAFAGCTSFGADDTPAKMPDDKPDDKPVDKPADKPVETPPDKYRDIVEKNGLLVSYWRLDDLPNSIVAKDSAPDVPLDGKYVNPADISWSQAGATSSDPSNKAVQFNGTNGHVAVDYNGFLSPPAFSLELWFKLIGPVNNQRQVLAGFYEVNATGLPARGYVLDVLRAAAFRVRVRLGDNLGAPGLLEVILPAPPTGWTHVVVTYGLDLTLRMYIDAADGLSDGQKPNLAYEPVTATAATFRIGAGHSETNPQVPGALGHFFLGQIDEVALYRGVLDAATIQNHFSTAKKPPS